MEENNSLHERIVLMGQRFGRLKKLEMFPDISRGEFYTLNVIYDFMKKDPQKQGIYAHMLAEKLRWSGPALSRMLKGLEEKGLILRSVDLCDRRNIYVAITDSGTARIEDARKDFKRRMQSVIDIMGRKDMEQLLYLWERMCAIMEEEIKNASN